MASPLSPASPDPRPAPARVDAVVTVGAARFTVLTSRLIRMERASVPARPRFTDAATQLVINRDLGAVPPFEVRRGDDLLEIITEHLHLTYRPSRGFSRSGLQVTVRTAVLGAYGGTWHHGDTWDPQESFPSNLGGTRRTLDEADGRVSVGPGLLSMNGYAVIDDSSSLLLTQDEWVCPRPEADPVDGSSNGEDLYLFGYGQDYQAALADFFRLTGPTPLVPRAVLGNWWSRYHRYSDTEYLSLMDRFSQERLPFSVAVIDMDWHLVDIDPSLGNGWTGYTWNRDLFPDPEAFLRNLHERGLQVALNLHPAGGIRRHEDAYPAMCRQLGLDPKDGADIPFNIADRAFTDAYLTHAHHPLEEQGVDFWWLDWQQGGVCDIPGLDPLWMLNHVHYLDSGRERTTTLPDGISRTLRRRPLTFSRFADASSHRTPLGFSGDTVTTWDSLRFQPEFTATAANIGYFWWSHDIGGHMLGYKDSQMMARWVQLGCLSPINRLHSSNSVFNSKEPWRFSSEARAAISAYLRLRHRLVPYLYTMARRAHTAGVGPVRPVYHDFPTQRGAYAYHTSYFFGDLLVVPMLSRTDPATGLSREETWLPPGTWFDLPTGRRYEAGDQGAHTTLSRPLAQVPVLARAGSLVLTAEDLDEHAGDNPQHLGLLVVPGDDGEMVVEEDDASPEPGPDGVTRTCLSLTWDESAGRAVLTLREEGGEDVVPEARDLVLHLVSVASRSAEDAWSPQAPAPDCHGIRALRLAAEGGCGVDLEVRARQADGYTLAGGVDVVVGALGVDERRAGVRIEITGLRTAPPSLEQEAFTILEPAELSYPAKDAAWEVVRSGARGGALLNGLRAAGLTDELLAALAEIA